MFEGNQGLSSVDGGEKADFHKWKFSSHREEEDLFRHNEQQTVVVGFQVHLLLTGEDCFRMRRSNLNDIVKDNLTVLQLDSLQLILKMIVELHFAASL